MSTRRWDAWQSRAGIGALALFVGMIVGGCAVNSEMTNLWRDPSYPAGSIHNVLVVAIRKDPVRRRVWEDAWVRALRTRGVTATASYSLYPGASPDTQQVVEMVREHDCDAVLTSIRLPDEPTSRYFPGAYRQEQVTTADFYGRLHSRWVNVQDPGYTEEDTIIQVQTDVWMTAGNGGHLVWSGTLRTLESVASRTADKAVSQSIMPELERDGVVPTKPR